MIIDDYYDKFYSKFYHGAYLAATSSTSCRDTSLKVAGLDDEPAAQP